MKILIFEHITGGGLAQEVLPTSLAREGELMLKMLVNELLDVSNIEMTVLLDWRFKELELPQGVDVVSILPSQDVYDLLPALIDISDVVWPIAPEMDSALLNISQCVEQKDKRLLNSSSAAVSLCSDKLKTYEKLKEQGIATVDTFQFNLFTPDRSGIWVVKPKNGVGCINSFLIKNNNELAQLDKLIDDKMDYVIQPYIMGDSLSLSCLFKQGKAWLLCCNRQKISIKQGRFELDACEVNIFVQKAEIYQDLLEKIAVTIPGLWGYVGVDIIQADDGKLLVLEINPRLTTSYVGISQALGFNTAKTVVNMVSNEPMNIPITDNEVIVNLT